MSSTERNRFDKLGAALLLVALAAALVVHFTLRMPLGLSLMIFFVAWPLGGTLITLDDDFKGGWSNPDGSVRPPWLEAPFWGQIAGGVAISLGGFAVDAGWASSNAARLWCLAAAAAFLSAALLTRRWSLLLGIAVGFGALLMGG
jgi:hypothetical protein